MNPLQFFRIQELFRAQRVANENVRVRQLLWKTIIVRKMHDVHCRPAAANSFGERRRRTPLAERMPHANGELRLLRCGASHYVLALTRKSRPVMSCGTGSPRMPSMVGAISRSAPPGTSCSPSFSLTQMNGTGF